MSGFGHVRAAAAAARVLHRQMKRRRAWLVTQHQIGARLEQTSHGSRTARANGAVQGRCAVGVLRVDRRPRCQQDLDRLDLPLGIPGRPGDEPVSRVVQRAALAAIACRIWVGPRRQQQLDDFQAIAGRGQMQGRIVDIKPMKNLCLVQPGLLDQARCKLRICPEQGFDLRAIVIKNDFQ